MDNNYNDGVIYFYKKKNKINSFKAQQNTKHIDDLEYISKYFYKQETQRHEDVVFAGAVDRKLSLKISVPYTENIYSEYEAIIKNYCYAIFHVDPDKVKNKTYIYLEGMRKIER